MKLGILSDIHGNELALRSVLDDMPPVDDIICLGDTIGYGPRPAECVELIRTHASVVLQGNHETYLHNPDRCAGNKMAYEGIKHAHAELTSEQHDWVRSLSPQELLFDDRVLAAHGWPDPETPFKYVRPGNVTEMIPYLRDSPAQLLTTGHLHVQFMQDLTKFHSDSGLFVNPGSVGQPRDNNPKAAYAIVSLDDFTTTLHRVEYDVETVREQIAAADLPHETGTRLTTGSLSKRRRI